MDYPDLKRAVRSHADQFRPTNILIEDKASGTQLIQELIREGPCGVTRYEPTMKKIMRLHSVTNTIENGFVYLPTEAHWRAVYLHELTIFPNGRHDDQADSPRKPSIGPSNILLGYRLKNSMNISFETETRVT